MSLSPQQARALHELEAYMTEMTVPLERAFWSNPTKLWRDSRWQNVRDLAKAALDAFAWHP